MYLAWQQAKHTVLRPADCTIEPEIHGSDRSEKQRELHRLDTQRCKK
ncbi:hypothetical protein VCR19J5_130061 [Vibrio crassostreae]|nr:hypothetical protein VCR19J5_130061 [Vibrio crassostreae]